MIPFYVSCFKDRRWRESLTVGLLLLFMSLVINFYAGTYATAEASNSVTDIILSNIPVFDVDGVFIYGAIALVICITGVCLSQPRRAPFIIKSISLLVVIRAMFITLTHIAPFPTQVAIDPLSWINNFTFGGDLFFSGHTAVPFLMALLCWKDRWLRYSFLTLSILFGVVTLMGHLHYSIDVFAAFFITYAIYHLAELLFKLDSEHT